MEGANIFIMYAASGSNITLSPRLGLGSFEPNYNPSAQVSLLEGTGISNNVMTANVRCESCISWSGGSMDVKSTSSNWIWAIKSGSAVDSPSVSVDLIQHDTMGSVAVDLTQGTGGSSSNPFVALSNSGSSTNTSSVSGSTDGSSSSYTTSGVTVIDSGPSDFEQIQIAHGFIMAFAFVVLFPVGALMRHLTIIPKVIPVVHVPIQLFALAMVITGLGLGVFLALNLGAISAYHPIIGMITVSALIAFQPLMGLLQHLNYRKNGTQSLFGYAHRWLGRILIVVGIINGGLGFMFAGIGAPGVPTAGVIAYGTIAGFMGVVYILTLFLSATRLKSPLNVNSRFMGNSSIEHSQEESSSRDGK